MLTDSKNNFTLLRLILSTLVVTGHFVVLTGVPKDTPLNDYAGFAVLGFFVVSGYLISASWERKPQLWDFFVKRAFRIYPLYALVVVVQTILMCTILPHPAVKVGDVAGYLFDNLLFMNFLHHDIGDMFQSFHNPGINASLWTLKIEVVFYALVPLIWTAFKKWGLIVPIVIFSLSTVYYVVLVHMAHYDLAKQVPGQLRYFIVGMMLYSYRARMRPGTAASILVILITFCLYTILLYSNDWWMNFLAPVLVGPMMFLFAMRVPAYDVKHDISFGVYLVHAPIIQISILFGVFRPSLWWEAGLIMVSYALAIVLEKTVEIPGINLGRKLLSRRVVSTPA